MRVKDNVLSLDFKCAFFVLGSNNRMFSAAPGAEAKYRNGPYMSSIGSSGSSLFPPTRIRLPVTPDEFSIKAKMC